MAEKDEHFMSKHHGPAKQFVALVGDRDGSIKAKFDSLDQTVTVEKDCYYIDTTYYSAKYGLKQFGALSEVGKDFDPQTSPIVCLLIVYNSMADLENAGAFVTKIKPDSKVIIIDSIENCSDHEKVEEFGTEMGFELVYMNPNEEQKEDAEELGETTGMARIVEIIQVCEWPWRVTNKYDSPSGVSSRRDDQERKVDYSVDSDEAGAMLKKYQEWIDRHDPDSKDTIPAPQHAERVHLSPDSPTTTEGTTNQEDANISVDIDLVCTKEKTGQSSEKSATPEKKNKEKTA